MQFSSADFAISLLQSSFGLAWNISSKARTKAISWLSWQDDRRSYEYTLRLFSLKLLFIPHSSIHMLPALWSVIWRASCTLVGRENEQAAPSESALRVYSITDRFQHCKTARVTSWTRSQQSCAFTAALLTVFHSSGTKKVPLLHHLTQLFVVFKETRTPAAVSNQAAHQVLVFLLQ